MRDDPQPPMELGAWRAAFRASVEEAEREGEPDVFFTFEEVQARADETLARVAARRSANL